MSKIMFNDHYGLQQAVIIGTKTMTRRIVKFISDDKYMLEIAMREKNETAINYALNYYAQYKVGEVLPIAQRYEEIWHLLSETDCREINPNGRLIDTAGWSNKMFVREKFMPHHIEMTGRRLEHLQDISDEDCLKEGVLRWMGCYIVAGIMEGRNESRHNKCFDSPREAFAALIDRISGKGTWKDNPWVVAYSFKKVD